jgi:arsenate reductase (glutaredoxin)
MVLTAMSATIETRRHADRQAYKLGNRRRDVFYGTPRPVEGIRVAKAITIYGIKNCDTMKKARAWLDKHRVAYLFHDYKTAGIQRERLEQWCKKVGWETLLNRAGTTFRKLPDRDKADIDGKKAVALMLDQPSMIKRPVLDLGGGKLLVGFAPELYTKAVS